MTNKSIKISNYKCFNSETGFDEIKRVNLIIGRNNSGKSSLLDIIDFTCLQKFSFEGITGHHGKDPQIVFSAKIEEANALSVFRKEYSGGKIGTQHDIYGKKLIGRYLKWSISKTGNNTNYEILELDETDLRPKLTELKKESQQLLRGMVIPFNGKTFKRLNAERDIQPEKPNTNIEVKPNGNGLTNAIQLFLNRSTLPSDLIEENLLDGLNKIFSPDTVFTKILCQQHENEFWEIYLEESDKGRIALSNSGSGLKTVILVLAYIHIIPHLEEKKLVNYVFGFEELENNIHPALLRRLNNYIYESSKSDNFTYFLTTHSNVLIDQFSKQDDAQIIHVLKKEAQTVCVTAKTYIHNNGIIDDLDVKASDLLQANGIIWVEGPSDRIYLNRWIELWSEGRLKEGTHYQIIFYGGRLLSHLSAQDPSLEEDGISLFNVNRNSMILIDSDKRNQQASINETKKRIKTEFEKINSFCWITKGKEIENYLSKEVIESFWGSTDSFDFNQYESLFDWTERKFPQKGKKFEGRKPFVAEKLISYMTKANQCNVLDLDKNLNIVIETIKQWNK